LKKYSKLSKAIEHKSITKQLIKI